MNKKLLILLGAILVIAYLALRLFGGSEEQIVYRTATVQKGDITSYVTATGSINPTTKINVTSKVTGTVKEIYVDYNSAVKSGEPLAEIDPTPFASDKKKAAADLRKAEAEYSEANLVFSTNKELYDSRLISKEEYVASSARRNSALAALDQAKATLESAQSNLEDSTIRSPLDGVVLSVFVEIGESVTARKETLFTVSKQLDVMKINTHVSEADIGQIKEGQHVTFTVDTYPNKSFEGRVEQIRNDPISDNNIVSYDVIVKTENTENKLKPGMTADVKILATDKKDVVRIPTSALRFIPPTTALIEQGSLDMGETPHVWVSEENGQLKAIAVDTGASDGEYTEITNNSLELGQTIITDAELKQGSDGGGLPLPQPRRF